ncbi:MBL fold metallo-hydrolase [Paraliomyxa miuraensis]|uniref:MBL fold metallo-hydrolase n=1 Tax=Paraliomyxa miuraensis TaxID=376150 RepID=UPI0022576631|nr:MBL fold metallo-hydrolase [Paraliomyxa miuraensis]MCX4247229.1 MBL fold metallo-hydrolase [Paraliomyxa miuraensis]
MDRLETLAPGVGRLPLRTPTLPPATSTNLLIVGHSRLVLIEPATPFEDERRVLDQVLEALAAEGRRVELLVVTHHHVDHIGDVERLQQRLGVPVGAHPETAARLSMPVDRRLEDGDELDLGEGIRMRAVHTPGHAPGHLVLHELSSGIAHAGDMVAGEGTILIDPEDAGDMGQYLDSLRRMGELGTRALVPAHGPTLKEPRAVVDHYVRHRLRREAKVLAAIDAGAEDEGEILARAYDDTPRVLWPLAARALEAHLRKLEVDGVIERHQGRSRRGG